MWLLLLLWKMEFFLSLFPMSPGINEDHFGRGNSHDATSALSPMIPFFFPQH